jgi:large subunit ribosomal protein L25
MKHAKLKVEKRTILGKKLKKLRRDGIIPGNVYGKNIKSQSVQSDEKELLAVYGEVGETGLVDLLLGEQTIPVLIQNVSKNFRNQVLHTDFYQVNLKEKVKASVPLEIIGEPKAITDKIGLLMNILDEVEVEALPESLPENIQVDVTSLANIDDQILVSDLKAPEGVEILTDKEQVVSKIGELVTKEAQEEAAQEAAEAQAAKEETAEGAEASEGAQAEGGQEEGTTPKEESTDSSKDEAKN